MKIIVDFLNFANTPKNTRVILGFRSDVDEKCALLGYYVASSGNSLPTFRDNLSIPSSRSRMVVTLRRLGITTTRCVITQKSAVVTPEYISLNFISHPQTPPRHFSFLLGVPWSIQNTTYHLTMQHHTMCNVGFIHCGFHFSRGLFLPKARLKLQ
jgi:hypothetical protein